MLSSALRCCQMECVFHQHDHQKQCHRPQCLQEVPVGPENEHAANIQQCTVMQ